MRFDPARWAVVALVAIAAVGSTAADRSPAGSTANATERATAGSTVPATPSLSSLLVGARAAPAFTARTIDGHRLDLATLTRHGPVLLDFWATWCEPCVTSLPELEAIHERYAARGFTVVGISVDGPRNFSKVRPFVSRYALTFPIVLDEDGSLQERYQVRALPTSILIDGEGRMVHVQTGYRPGTNDEVESAVRLLCAAAPGDSGADSTRLAPRTP
ncbi:MAG: TlpA disulfide reductase family protein [Candidatus Eisenbacteria bacterium]